MTQQFDNLKDQPQTGIHLTDFTPDERTNVRRINLHNRSGRSKYTTVYYISGDEKRAAEEFVEQNREQIQTIDFSKNRNEIQSNVDREIYDWILQALGERELQKYDTVVVERRSDGTTWVIEREHFEKATARRYTISDQVAAQTQGETLQSLYDRFEGPITESDLRGVDAIEGDVRYVLDVYRAAPEFDCKPISVEGELAIQKNS